MEKVKVLINVVLFICFMAMVILGQRNVGGTGLAIQVVGLTGLLVLLYFYNRKRR